MKAAYADPPYIGQARAMYDCEEADHAALVCRLEADFDAYALSCSSTSLRAVIAMCRPDVRVAAWVKPFAFFKGSVRPPYAWEPVIFWTPRAKEFRPKGVRDWISLNAFGVTRAERATHGIKGAKRPEFSKWIFALLGLNADDEFYDLFPGSGMVTQAWEEYRLGH